MRFEINDGLWMAGRADAPTRWRLLAAATLASLCACSASRVRNEEVRFSSDSVSLTGTLYLPHGPPPHAAVVIIHGSGAQTREPYAPLARQFAARGIAALTYDKRGTGGSTGDWRLSPFEALGDDASAGINYLRGRADIAAGRVGIWGGSEGGWIAPAVASGDSLVAFVIVQSAPVVRAAEQHAFQVERLIASRGGTAADLERAREYVGAQHRFAAVREGWSEYERMRVANRGTLLEVLGGPVSSDDWWWTWWATKMQFDPVRAWANVRVPVLAIWGARDDLVPVEASRRALDSLLRRPGERDVQLDVVKNSTHDLEPTGARRVTMILERVLFRRAGVTPSMKRMAEWASERFTLR